MKHFSDQPVRHDSVVTNFNKIVFALSQKVGMMLILYVSENISVLDFNVLGKNYFFLWL